jgi:predicted phosphodiesterase
MKRRSFLHTTALAAGSLSWPSRAEETKSAVEFFLVGDTHYRAEEATPGVMMEASKATNARLIAWLNVLPGTVIPVAAGGGQLADPHGVIHAGDLIDSGDKNGGPYPEMQKTEWKAFHEDWGLNGGDGKLRWPVREVHGNHDSPNGTGLVIDQIKERNTHRHGLTKISANGLHYSWDWQGVHFVNLGIVVGEVASVKRKRRYAPMGSLDFLISDLEEHVGKTGKPVVITHHVDMIRYAAPSSDAEVVKKEWDYADVQAFHEALKPYRVAAILYGHTHVRNIFRWNGDAKPAPKDPQAIPVFNTDNAGHFKSDDQALLHFTISDKETLVREFYTTDAWATAAWREQVWRFALPT